MSYTKGELISMALEEIGIASYEFDISPEQQQSALRRLDAMIAEWNQRGILLGYPIAKQSEASVDEDSNIPDWAWTAVATNLGKQLAPSYGKQISPETRILAKKTYDTLLAHFAQPKEAQFNSMPKGAGYKTTEFRWIPEPTQEYLTDINNEFDPSIGVTNDE